MQILSIAIGSDKKPKYNTVPLVVGENKTTFVTVSSVPADWTGLTLYALVTTPKRVKVDEFEMTDIYDGATGFYLLNSMLDAPGVLHIEYIAKSGAQEVSRTALSAKLGVASARSEVGDIPPEPLPDLIADVTAAGVAANQAAADIAGVPAAEAIREANEEGRVIAEQDRVTEFNEMVGDLENINTLLAAIVGGV